MELFDTFSNIQTTQQKLMKRYAGRLFTRNGVVTCRKKWMNRKKYIPVFKCVENFKLKIVISTGLNYLRKRIQKCSGESTVIHTNLRNDINI